MNTRYVDPLIPLGESADDTLRRLSSNIATLGQMNADATRFGNLQIARMFAGSLQTKVEEAKTLLPAHG